MNLTIVFLIFQSLKKMLSKNEWSIEACTEKLNQAAKRVHDDEDYAGLY